MNTLVSLVLLAAFSTVTSAAPTLNYPIQAQLPLVARIDKAYSWTLYPDTFTTTSNSGSLNYTTSALPGWLSFDPVSLAFYGSPGNNDDGEISITVSATDGSVTEDTFNILVTDNATPGVHRGFDTQIGNPALHNFNTAVALPSNDGVLLHPYYSFSMGFQQSTFRPGYEAVKQDIFYSAYLRGTMELPDWLNFDNQTVTFSGVAPSSGTYTVVVTGSDYWGYSAVQNGFTIQVSTAFVDVPEHEGVGNITTVAGTNVNFKLDLSAVDVNGAKVEDAGDLDVSVDLEGMEWLSFDASTLMLTGTTPEKYINGTTAPMYIPVMIADQVNGTTANTTVYLPVSIEPSLFNVVSLPNATAKLGDAFTYDLKPYIRDTKAISALNVSVSPSSNYTEWIKLVDSSFELSGTPPNQSSTITKRMHDHRRRRLYKRADARAIVQISATDARTGLESIANLNLDLAGLPTAAIPAPTSSESPSSSAGTGGGKKGGLSNGAKIALGVVFGLLGVALLAALLFFCCFRRRNDKSEKKTLDKSRKSTESFAGMIKSPKAERNPFSVANFAMFGAGPATLPRSESAKLQNGEVPNFSSIYVQRPSAEGDTEPVRVTADEHNEKPRQMDAMRGILQWNGTEKRDSNGTHQSVPGLEYPSPVPGEIIRNDGLMPPGEASDFTHSFTSTSESRASWESRETFQWSSGEGMHAPYIDANGRPLSSAPSVPRPRNDFTPRYPRNALAPGMNRPPSDTFSGHTFSEFHDHHVSEDHTPDSLTHTHTGTGSTSFGTGTISDSHTGSGTMSGSGSGSYEIATRAPAGFTAGPSALGRIIGESDHFAPVAEEDEGYSDESAVLAVAERQSFDNQEAHRAARLMPSRERFTQSPAADMMSVASHTPSQEAIAGENSDAFDDADEEGVRDRASTVYAPSDLTGLGYPAEAIVFGNRTSQALSNGQRSESMRFVPQPEESVLSPPLPQVGNLMHTLSPPIDGHRPISSGSGMTDGRYIAQTNETFNLHPHINPPPQVSLSASTWSAPTPSTYRIESADGSPLPSWLHWDGKELELWGIPALGDAGQVLHVKVVERIPKPKRKSYDSSQLIPGEATEREVGSCIIEVADNLKSPDAFSLEGSFPAAI